jgi:hypothetical protein
MGKAVDWQTKVINWLADVPCVVLNPRRLDWDSSWKQEFENPQFREQVEWELKGLEQATFIAMCFAEKSQAPISLLELGLHVIGRRMIVFCPNGYWRKGNVDVVCNRYGVPVYEDFDEFLRMVKARILETSSGVTVPAVLPEGTVQDKTKYFLTASDKIAKRLLLRDFVVASWRARLAVSELPNDVTEEVQGEEYPQEYLSPSPGGMGSVRPGDDIMLTGRSRRAASQWIQELAELEPRALACSGLKSRVAFEFPTKKSLQEYLRQHPDADEKLHWVKKPKSAPHGQVAPAAPTKPSSSPTEKAFGIHTVFDSQHQLGKQEDKFRSLIGAPNPKNPWQTEDKDAIRQLLTKKLGRKPKYDEIKHEIQQRKKAGEVVSYGFWSASKHTEDPSFQLDMVTNRKGMPLGMVTHYENEDHDLEVGALASSGLVKGMGTYLLAKTIKEHLKEKQKLTLSALDTAKPFYQHIGMKPVDPIGPLYYFEHDDAVKFADRVFKEMGSRAASLNFRGLVDKVAMDLMAAKEKKHYRFDPGHRRKPGPGWSPTEAGWTKPRPTQLEQSKPQVLSPIGVQPRTFS